MVQLSFTLNGDKVETWVKGHEMLIDLLRENFKLIGAREGCGMGECGACTVLVNGLNINSCLFPALEVDGQIVETADGLADAGKFHPLQQAFLDNGASQCGFCTPGMLMSAKAFLDDQEANLKGITDA
ncbi:MAG: 2Fe-2S iron-sulfur cluster-binding protein, partial [Pseudomonadota bacterium]|nr:2Fe-2S iron-sulfur cluster-binding protein [Pseudomonadota bacterium]